MQISMTSGRVSSGRNGRTISSSAEAYSLDPELPGPAGSPAASPVSASAPTLARGELIDRPEVDIAGHQHLNARAVAHP